MDGEPEADLLLHLDDDRFSLLGEIGTLRRDEKGIEMFLHGSPETQRGVNLSHPGITTVVTTHSYNMPTGAAPHGSLYGSSNIRVR